MNLNTGHLLAGGRYKVERVLGQGGFGITYEARDTKFKSRVKSVAIKEFFVKDFCNREQETNRIIVATQSKVELVKKLQNKFIDEANALFELEHPGIVRVTDTFEENGTAYYVMEYINGSSLSNIVETEGPLNEDMALGYIRQAASALEYLHGQNRLHLDIKPQNIMVDNDGRVVLIDFGVSKQYDEVNGENTSTLLGSTPGYAPIEQSGSGVSEFYPSTDIYSLGATLYKLLTGNTPLPAHQLASGETLPPLPHSVSAATRKAVECAMSLNRNNRPQNIGEFLALLDKNVKAENGKVKTESNDDGATEILHSVQDDKYREKNSSTKLGEVPQAEGYNPNRAFVISTERSDGEISSTDAGETVFNVVIPNVREESPKKHPFNKRLITIISLVAICIIAIIFGVKSCNGHKEEGAAENEPYAKQQIETLLVPLLDKSTGKYGFVDSTGKLAIPCKYDDAWLFFEGLARVVLDGKWGFVDSTGKLAIPCKYDAAWLFSEGLARVRLDGKYGFVDSTGKLAIPCKYDDAAHDFSEGLARVKLDGKWSFIDSTGKLAIPCKYDWAGSFSEGLAMVELDGKWGFVDSTGKLAIPCKYDAAGSFSEGLAGVKLDGKYGFVDSTGKLAIPCKYAAAYPFSEGLTRVWLDGPGFYIDKNGKEYIK